MTKHISVQALVTKYDSAIKGRDKSKVAFEDLDANMDELNLKEWREEEQQAMKHRGECLRIYEVKIEKGVFLSCLLTWLIRLFFSPISC